ncbi:hypothetical protein [Glycomyces rhizosphaerae]|uniref:DUF2207 domain-containing protein n=1 Tax=Glycomyces rhizosphaerae TaxID=2054422 RepID=A0ABV7Q3U4_9ACTN
MPRRAAQFLSAAYEGGLKSNQLYFYWALSILSGRSDIDLSGEEFDQLQHCIDATDHEQADSWSQGVEVVGGLLWASGLNRTAGTDQDAIDQVLLQTRKLDPDVRSEVLLHLDRIVSGSVFDYLWEDHRADVERRRHAGDRERRVPKFFIHDPLPPKMPAAVPYKSRPGAKASVAGGLAIALFVALPMALGFPGGGATIALLAATAASTTLIAYFGRPLALRTKRMQDRRAEMHGSGIYLNWAPLNHRQTTFNSSFANLLKVAFEVRTPTGYTPNRWLAATQDFRLTAAYRVTLLYCQGDTRPSELRWLADHLAKEQAGHHESGLLWDPQYGVPPETEAQWGVIGGICLFGATVLIAGVSTGALGFLAVLVSAAAIAGALWLILPNAIELAIGRRYYAERLERAEEALQRARQSHAEWAEWLSDRPSDPEMAQWLAADLNWLRIEAMEALRLPHQDVIAHFAISESAEDAKAARVPFGPTRYSSYNLRIFLLTENGVRVYTATLNFSNGSHLLPGTDNFQYEKIVSARVVEIGVHYGGRRRMVVDLEQAAYQGYRDFTLAHALNLQIHGRELRIIIGANHGEALVKGEGEDAGSLLSLDLESSGIEEGLRILQAVAGEGRGWIETERARQRHYIKQQRRGPSGLDVSPTGRTLELDAQESGGH